MEDVLKERDVMRSVLEQKDAELKSYQRQIEELMTDVGELGKTIDGAKEVAVHFAE